MFTSKSKRLLFSIIVVMALTLAIVPGAWGQEGFTLTILHTNDTHAHLESFEPFEQPVQGGVARRITAVEGVRAEGGNVLLLDAGDVFQGTLYFNMWNVQADLWFMNEMGYEAMAVGNHEFDKDHQTLAEFVKGADFPLLSANLDFSHAPILDGLIKPYVILEVGGEKVGIFGLTTEEVGIISNIGPDVVINDPIESAKGVVAELEGQGVEVIIALTHIGYSHDKELAAAVDGIDVIIGGHEHTLLGSMEGAEGPYPSVVASPSGEDVLIIQAYQWGSYLGRLDLTFDAEGKVASYSGEPIFIDESIEENAEFAAKLAEFAAPIEELKNTVIGQSEVELVGERPLVRTQETNLANLITDAMLWKTAADNTVIAIQNGGGIRASISPGDVTMGNVMEVLPFGNQIVDVDLTGAQIKVALENGVSRWEEQDGRFPQVAGIKYSFDPSQPVGSRIVSIEVDGAPIDMEAIYRVTVNDFLFAGGDGYDVLAEGTNPYETGFLLSDSVAEYIAANSPVHPVVEGRITKVE